MSVLERLHNQADEEDGPASQRVRAREAAIGERLAQAQRYELYGEAPLAIAREVGQFLYLLASASAAKRVVEFGCSLGVSTIYLAAALRDSGGGTLISSERHERKNVLAERNLADAGLGDLIELRAGDALNTLSDIAAPVDLVFLDGARESADGMNYRRLLFSGDSPVARVGEPLGQRMGRPDAEDPFEMSPRIRLLLLLTLVGFVVPNGMVVVFFAEHGVDLGRYLDSWFATLPSTQLVVDLVICCVTFIVWSAWDGSRAGVRRWWVTIPATVLVGLCFAIPLYLLLRERALASAAGVDRE